MQEKSFFGCLFDLSFTDYITNKILGVLYVLCIIGSAVLAIGVLIKSFTAPAGIIGVLGLILCPIVFLLSLIVTRMCLEMVAVLFRIAGNTTKLVDITDTCCKQKIASDDTVESQPIPAE